MRFTRITAHAHGPFTGEILKPAPGFSVVWGLNEAGKSSWHSAAHLTITGLTRKRGRPPKNEQHTIDRAKPRAGEQWRLEAELLLDDGDDLTVTWDLQNRVAKVLDSLGRDRSNEWLTDGAPDLARIVGLDRASFLATACVRQSDLQRVRDDAGILQELLQKATTSADADATAAAAITLIDQFRKDRVGVERENATRPLMKARRRVDATSQALIAAQAGHQDRLELLADLTARRVELEDRRDERHALQAALAVAEARHRHDQLVHQSNELDVLARGVQDLSSHLDQLAHRQQVLLAARHHADQVEAVGTIQRQLVETEMVRRAADDADRAHNTLREHLAWVQLEQARRTAQRSRQRFARAAELEHRHPAVPARPTDHDELARQAHVLVDRWNKRPILPVLTGPTADDLAQQLAALPEGHHDTTAPAAAPRHHRPVDTGRADRPTHTSRAIGALGVAVVGLILGIVVHPVLYLVAVAGVVAFLLTLRHRFEPATDDATEVFQERLERAEAAGRSSRRDALSAQLVHRRAQEQQVADTEALLDRLDRELARMATALGARPDLPSGRRAETIARWLAGHEDHRRQLQLAHEEWVELTNLLGGGPLHHLAGDAEKDEQLLEEQMAAVSGLRHLAEDLQSIDDRVLRDRSHQLMGATADASRDAAKLRSQVPGDAPELVLRSAQVALDEALHRLRRLDPDTAGHLAGCSTEQFDAQLEACRDEHDQCRQARDESAGHLRHLREASRHGIASSPSGAAASPSIGSTTERASGPAADIASEIGQLEQAFFALPAHAMVGFSLHSLPATEALRSQILAVNGQEDRLHQAVAGLQGRLEERDAPGAAADPAAAVENHEAAVRELARVRELAEVLDETRSLLVAAEDRVHRDIAPRLNTVINRWLPRIFGDRYTKVLIDPAHLDVQVFAAGDSVRADLLSQGTSEQFYLLLRVALTETLTTVSGESCPLLLDEITVNFDRERKAAVLELLREVATERQVVLFTQEDDVRAWAQANLSGTDTLIELPGRVSA